MLIFTIQTTVFEIWPHSSVLHVKHKARFHWDKLSCYTIFRKMNHWIFGECKISHAIGKISQKNAEENACHRFQRVCSSEKLVQNVVFKMNFTFRYSVIEWNWHFSCTLFGHSMLWHVLINDHFSTIWYSILVSYGFTIESIRIPISFHFVHFLFAGNPQLNTSTRLGWRFIITSKPRYGQAYVLNKRYSLSFGNTKIH